METDYAKVLGHPLNEYHDIKGVKLSDFASFMIDEHGGFPIKYASRITITKAGTGKEENKNTVIILALDGKEIGMIMAILNRHISYRGKEGDIFLWIDPDNKNIKKTSRKGRYKETFLGKEVQLYGDSIWFKTFEEMFDFYEEHKAEIGELP
jgi:hypothetical protein